MAELNNELNQGTLRLTPENICDKSLWYMGPDEKFYPTPEALRKAQEEWLIRRYKKEWLKSKTYDNQPGKKIIKKEKPKPPSLTNPEEIQPSTILSPNILKALTESHAGQLSALADFLAYFLNSFPPPPTSSTE
jgi:hypothetical protein